MDVQEIEKVPEAITELQRTTVERRVFHFALGAAASLADLKVVANGQEVALTPHTGTTRSALRSHGTLWQKIDQSHLTHFATVALPRERVLLLSVHGHPPGPDGGRGPGVPRSGAGHQSACQGGVRTGGVVQVGCWFP
jgi:hypothetical protein